MERQLYAGLTPGDFTEPLAPGKTKSGEAVSVIKVCIEAPPIAVCLGGVVHPQYSVVSEKFEAVTKLGMANTRIKDFFDLWFLQQFA